MIFMIWPFRAWVFRSWPFYAWIGGPTGGVVIEYAAGFCCGPEYVAGDEGCDFSAAFVSGAEHCEGMPA